MISTTTFAPTLNIEPGPDDMHDRAYRFGKPLTYLSDHQQARLLILRSRLRA